MMGSRFPVQSLLSARLLLSPQLAGGRVYFLSDMSGIISLFAMDHDGGIPEPLLPVGLALQNPHLMSYQILIATRVGSNYFVLPKLHKILLMIDEDGNENYQPCFIPLEGGVPEPIFGNKHKDEQFVCLDCDITKNIAYFYLDDRKTPDKECLRVDLATVEVTSLGKSIHGNYFNGVNSDHSATILTDSYTLGDNVLYISRKGTPRRQLLYGIPIEKRRKSIQATLPNIGTCNFVPGEKGLLFRSNLFNDEGSASYLPFDDPTNVVEVPISGTRHKGAGELLDIRHVGSDLFLLEYNTDGCSWVYECRFFGKKTRWLRVKRTLCGLTPLDKGVQLGISAEVKKEKARLKVRYVMAFAKANSPAQLYLYSTEAPSQAPRILSKERVLGIEQKLLSEGEDASYKSFDGLRISARLYMPSKHLAFEEPRPLILYIHGGPQSQERPDFTWFSMPLIQFLTLDGFAVFVPNVRGSTGYGLRYMKMVDRDWGGNDMLDHIEGLKMLEKNPRIDSSRRAVIGRSYGGFMTLTLVSRYPNLWKAGCDMFGPYDLLTLSDRLPEAWKPYFHLSMGHPTKDRDFLIERSPKTYLKDIKCPMLIVQGKNDPRLLETESREIVENLKANGIDVEFLVFEDEGHDVTKLKNKILCYTKITDFFEKHLTP